MKYFIVTPTKNEEKNITRLIKLIEKQTVMPILWVFVDESADGTKEIIKKLAKKYGWLKYIHLEKGAEYLGINYGVACKLGFDFAIQYCKQYAIEYDYIGLIDADVDIENDFFEKLMIQLEKEPDLGIVSGNEYWEVSRKLVSAGIREDIPMGPARMWRKKCFEDTGGYQATASPDSVSNIKAKIKGWKTKRLKEVTVITRRTSTAKGYWWGAVREGKNYYFLNSHPLVVLFKSIRYSLKLPCYTGLGLIIGYFDCLIQRKEKIEDDEVKHYYRYIRPKEIFWYYFSIKKIKDGLYAFFKT